MISKARFHAALLALTFFEEPSILHSAPAKKAEKSVEFSYVVVASDFSRHKVLLKFSGDTWLEQYQTGRSADVSRGRLQDTRDCHWDVWNSYSSTHVATTNFATGATEEVRLGASLFKTEGFPLHAPVVKDISHFLANIRSFLPLEPIDRILSNGTQLQDPAEIILTVAGRVVARASGLRKGTNCGEAADAIDATVSNFKASLGINMEVLPWYGYYMNSRRLMNDWSYLDTESNRFVRALFVYPDMKMPDYAMAVADQFSQLRDAFQMGPPTESESTELWNLVEKEPDNWIEKLIANYADRFGDKILGDYQDNALSNIDVPTIDPWQQLSLLRRDIPFLVLHTDYPEVLTPEFRMLEDLDQRVIRECGGGRLYEVQFEKTLTESERETALLSLNRAYSNCMTFFAQKLSRVGWLYERLPKDHELSLKISGKYDSLLHDVADYRELGLVFNPRNRQYQNALIEARKKHHK